MLIIARLYSVNKLFDFKFKMYESDAIFINELSRYENVGFGTVVMIPYFTFFERFILYYYYNGQPSMVNKFAK